LDECDTAQNGRRGIPGYIADNPTTKGHDTITALDAVLEQMIVDVRQRGHVLRTFAAGDKEERSALTTDLHKCSGMICHLGIGDNVDAATQTDCMHGGG
jgi:hypothetical protein